MPMLDIDAIVTAADSIIKKQQKQPNMHKKQLCFLCISDKKQEVTCSFECLETLETDFGGGVDANWLQHSKNRQNNPISPRPPEVGRNREKPAEVTIPVSFVSSERDYQYSCGFEASQVKKHHCFLLFLVFLADVEPSAELEPLIERAALMEYEGGLSRAEAEAKALEAFISQRRSRDGLCITLEVSNAAS